jgi:hypothetical protein
VRRVTRTLVTTTAMLLGVIGAAAQAPEGIRPALLVREIPPQPVTSPLFVTERLISFDANADHRISSDELPERMQGLVARGDKNVDGALDAHEVHALVHAAASERISVSFRSQPSDGLPGVINDLKLPPAKHARALTIVSGHTLPRDVNDPPNGTLFQEMRAVLDDEEYENFVAATVRLARNPLSRVRVKGGAVGDVPLQLAPPGK